MFSIVQSFPTYVVLLSTITLNKKQRALRSGHSNESAQIHMADAWLQATNDSNSVGYALVDFHKAFDRIDHKLLPKKLQHYKINNLGPLWFKSFLCYRIQQVNININQSKTNQCTMWRTTWFYFSSSVILIFNL